MTTLRVHAAAAARGGGADDDERDLQRKALAQWERQREVWQRMQHALEAKRSAATATRCDDNNNSTRRHARTLLSTSTWRARERNEDLSLLQLAVPRSALTSHRVWESTLRNNDDDVDVDEDHDDDADRNTRRPRRRTAHERCVQLGRACYPYALFGKVRDATALPPSSTSLARVVSDAHEHDNDNDNDDNADETAIASVAAAQRRRRAHATLLQRRQQATTRRARDDAAADDNDNTYSSALQRQLTLADAAAAAAAANGDDDHDATATRPRAASVDDYYARQLHLFAPYVQKRLPHFLLPRSFLCVHGQPAPCVRASDCSNNTRSDNNNNDGVEYVAPLPPRSLYAVADTRACVTAATNNDNDDDDVTAAASSCASTVAARVHTAPPSPRATSDDDAKNNNNHNNNIAASDDDDDDDGEATATTPDVTPRVVLSTSQLLFRAAPGELVHGHVDIRNTSRLTVYYSWRHTRLVDSDDEDEEELQARQGDSNNANNNDDSNNNVDDNTNDEARRLRVLRRRLYAHAHHARRARHLVYLVSGVNGVLLPHRTRRLAVAFRAPHAGYFCHTYELLTVPTCVERVTLTLCAHVQSRDAAARVVAAPVARALRVRATRDAQRQLLQHLMRAPAPYDAADVDASVARVRAAHDVAAAARAREVAAQRHAWCVANRATFDELPYNIAVYAHLSRLHDSVAATLHTLATAPPTAATATTTTTTSMTATARRVDDGDTPPPHSMTPLPAPRWDGSVARLLGDVCEVRDAAARNTLLTAMLTLLRLARVSADETDAVAVLLRRAALALVLQHDARTLMLQHDELEALQWQSLTRAAAAKASGGSNNTSGGGGSGAAAASAAGGGGAAARKSRSTSLVSNRARQATNSGGNTDGASSVAATSRGASPAGVAGGGGGAAVTTALSHGSLATLAATLRGGGGNSSSAAAGTTATLPAVAAQLTSDDVAALQREHDVLLSQRIAALTSTRVARVAAVAAQLRDAVDAGCALPLLDVVHAWRVDEVRVVQAADDMDVDTTSAGILPAKPSKRR